MVSVLGFSVLSYGSPLLGTYQIPGTSVKLSMRKEIAPLLVAYARDFNNEVEPLHAGWCWGFNPKHIEGSSVWSNHAWGGALDLNAPNHPMGKTNTFSSAKQKAIDKLLARYSYKGTRLLRSGKDYKTRRDDMHIEINVTRAVALAAVAAMTYKAGSRTLIKGMSGADVQVMQKKIGIKVDGLFGSDTEAALKKWQKAKGLTADGMCGKLTWAKILA
jgi:peptidoglycan hydrolase-like protein with peptidoglycan-binding domain